MNRAERQKIGPQASFGIGGLQQLNLLAHQRSVFEAEATLDQPAGGIRVPGRVCASEEGRPGGPPVSICAGSFSALPGQQLRGKWLLCLLSLQLRGVDKTPEERGAEKGGGGRRAGPRPWDRNRPSDRCLSASIFTRGGHMHPRVLRCTGGVCGSSSIDHSPFTVLCSLVNRSVGSG